MLSGPSSSAHPPVEQMGRGAHSYIYEEHKRARLNQTFLWVRFLSPSTKYLIRSAPEPWQNRCGDFIRIHEGFNQCKRVPL